MAIALDTGSATRALTTSAASATLSYTCTGSNRILFATVQWGNATLGATVSSVTYNGVAMTHIGTDQEDAGNRLSLYALIAPATGTNNLVFTLSTTVVYIALNAISFTGVSQTGQPEANNSVKSAGVTTLADPVTTVTDNAWVVIGASGSVADPVAGTNVTATSGASNGPLTGYFGPKTPAGSISLSVDASGGSQTLWSVVAAFAPAAGSTTWGPSISDRWCRIVQQ